MTLDLSNSLDTFTTHVFFTLVLSFEAIVIFAVPTDFPVTTPSFTSATASLDEVHTTSFWLVLDGPKIYSSLICFSDSSSKLSLTFE